MERGQLGPGSRGRDRRRRLGKGAQDAPSARPEAGGSLEGAHGEETGSSPGEPPRERVHAGRPLVIVSIHRDTSELKELARTLGLRLVLEVFQNRNRPHPGTFLGRGKLERLKAWLDEWKAGQRPGDWRWVGTHWVPEEQGGPRGPDVSESSESTSWGGWRARGDDAEEAGGPSFSRSDHTVEGEEPAMADFGDRDLLVIVDEDVRPAVLFNMEERLGVEVWGRTRLILEIFSQHAHLKEARLQVELAQLRYDVPMVHEAIHRKRRGERPGFMGGGEYAVAEYEDFIKRRMRTIRDELQRVRHDRAVRRKVRRDRFYLVSLAGYTNAGKSSLLSALTGAQALEESALFSTLGTMTRRLEAHPAESPAGILPHDDEAGPMGGPGQEGTAQGDGPGRGGSWEVESKEDPLTSYRRPILVTDTVGFIRALPSWLVEAFHATLEEIALADVVLLVVDVSDPPEVLVDKVRVGMSELAHLDVTCPILVVLNKTDLVDQEQLRAKAQAVLEETATRPEWITGLSAREAHGIEDLVALIQGVLPQMVGYRVSVKGVDEGQRLLNRLQGWGEVQHVDYGARMEARGLCDPIYWKDLQREVRDLGAQIERTPA